MATINYSFPSQSVLTSIAQDKIPRLIADRPAFQLMPVRNLDSNVLIWEQKDNYKGLQGLRGLNGQPNRVQPNGSNRYIVQPGVYGDYTLLDEMTMTTRAQFATYGQTVNVADLVMENQDMLLSRMYDRIELTIWLTMRGTFTNYGQNGAVLQTDTFGVQTFTASTAWSSTTTATPLADLRQAKLKARGHSVDFGRKAKLYLNQKEINYVLQNTNPNDLGGRRINTGNTLNTLTDVNAILMDNDLPQLVPYDEGYFDEAGTFQLFIPDNTATLVGVRPAGQTVGEYLMTRNLNNPNGAPGPYMKVINRTDDQVPPIIEEHVGHNGGPVLYYANAIVQMSV